MDNSKLENLDKLDVPNCGLHCTLNELKTTFETVIPDDWDAECQL